MGSKVGVTYQMLGLILAEDHHSTPSCVGYVASFLSNWSDTVLMQFYKTVVAYLVELPSDVAQRRVLLGS